MDKTEIRPMRPEDWEAEEIRPGAYYNPGRRIGYQRRDGLGGNTLYPACDFEARLLATFQGLRAAYPGVCVARYIVRLPYWTGPALPQPADYGLRGCTTAASCPPERLTTTSVTVILTPQSLIKEAEMGFYFKGERLPSLRARLEGERFQGVAGNLGYYMTEKLVKGPLRWSHNARYPDFPLPPVRSYLGFYAFRDSKTGELARSFRGAHPGAVGIRHDGTVALIPELETADERCQVHLWGQTLSIDAVDPSPEDYAEATRANVLLFTPGNRTLAGLAALVSAAEASGGRDTGWQRYAPMIPLPDRLNIFIANEGNGAAPVDRVVQVWDGAAPLPSFGAVLSLSKAYFAKKFPSALSPEHSPVVRAALLEDMGARVSITTRDGTALDDYVQVMGGLVPAVIEGQHIYCNGVRTVPDVMRALSRYGATSPIANCGRESLNFDPVIREPAGLVVETYDQRIGWVLFDGRHELSIGASVVDVGMILNKLEREAGVFGVGLRHACFVDGGSAMKVYAVDSDGAHTALDLLNRVAAGSRNGPGVDPDGLNLYTLLKLRLA